MSVSSGSAAPGGASDLELKVAQYEHFIENTLKRDLAACINAKEAIQNKHNEYSALRQSLQALQAQHEAQLAATGVIARQKSMINLGSEFYARAVVPDPTRLFLDVGLNFHVELSVPEALAWIDLKLPSLDRKLSHHTKQSSMIQSKIKIVYEGIAEVMQLQEQQKKPQRQIY